MRRRPKRLSAPRKSPLSIDDILAWADAYRDRTGGWPVALRAGKGKVEGQGDLTWAAVDLALSRGYRCLPGGTTLAKLLVERRGHRHHNEPPPLTLALILQWADAHFARTGQWPTAQSGAVLDAPGETWAAIHHALLGTKRGIVEKTSLAQLLAQERGRPNGGDKERLTVEQILGWAREWRARTGRWPVVKSGPIGETGETWERVNAALVYGLRGLVGGTSLPQLLADRCGARLQQRLPRLTVGQVLQWARAHHATHGSWPTWTSGPVDAAPGETWSAIGHALRKGLRGLPAGVLLGRLLAEEAARHSPTE